MDLKRLRKNIKKSEGCSLELYKCPANRTSIGYGRNLQDNGISLSEANFLLDNDLLRCKLELVDNLDFFDSLNDVRQNVLIEMCFNMGLTKFLNFKKTFEYIKNLDFESASLEMLDSKWHRDFIKYDLIDGKRSKDLLRSEHLSLMFKTGLFIDVE